MYITNLFLFYVLLCTYSIYHISDLSLLLPSRQEGGVIQWCVFDGKAIYTLDMGSREAQQTTTNCIKLSSQEKSTQDSVCNPVPRVEMQTMWRSPSDLVQSSTGFIAPAHRRKDTKPGYWKVNHKGLAGSKLQCLFGSSLRVAPFAMDETCSQIKGSSTWALSPCWHPHYGWIITPNLSDGPIADYAFGGPHAPAATGRKHP